MDKPDNKRLLRIVQGLEVPHNQKELMFYQGYILRMEGKSLMNIQREADPKIEQLTAEELRYFIYGLGTAENDILNMDIKFMVDGDENKTH